MNLWLVCWVPHNWEDLLEELSVAESNPPNAVNHDLVLPVGHHFHELASLIPPGRLVAHLVLYHHVVPH